MSNSVFTVKVEYGLRLCCASQKGKGCLRGELWSSQRLCHTYSISSLFVITLEAFSLEPVFPLLMVGTVGTLLTLRGTGCMPRKLLVQLFGHSPHPYESLSLFRGHVQVVPKSIISVHPCTLLQHSWGSIWHQRCQGTWRLWKSGSCQL